MNAQHCFVHSKKVRLHGGGGESIRHLYKKRDLFQIRHLIRVLL